MLYKFYTNPKNFKVIIHALLSCCKTLTKSLDYKTMHIIKFFHAIVTNIYADPFLDHHHNLDTT